MMTKPSDYLLLGTLHSSHFLHFEQQQQRSTLPLWERSVVCKDTV